MNFVFERQIILQRGISCISERSTAAVYADRDTADKVAHAHGKAGPEQGESSEVVSRAVKNIVVADVRKLGGEDDGHDDSVNSNNFAEDDGDQVLRSYTRGLDTSSDDGYSGCEDSPFPVSDAVLQSGSNIPGGSNDRQTNAKGDAYTRPCVGVHALEELSDLRLGLAMRLDCRWGCVR